MTTEAPDPASSSARRETEARGPAGDERDLAFDVQTASSGDTTSPVARTRAIFAPGLDLAVGELLVIQRGVGAVLRQELDVGASLDDPPSVEVEDLSAARIVDSRCAMAIVVRPCHQRVERLLDEPLGVRVEGARGLVEDQDRAGP